MSKAVFLGDSITMGYGLPDPARRFSTVFCRMADFQEINFGICGTLIARAGLSRKNGTSFIDRCPLMPDADLVVVFGGTNDYFWTDEPISSPGSGDDKYFSSAVRHLCAGLKAKYPGKPVIFILPYQMRGIGKTPHSTDADPSTFHCSDEKNFVGCTLADYVDMQLKICGEENIPCLDLFHDPEIDIAHRDSDFQNFTLDGCHPNENGHRRIAEKLYRFCRVAVGVRS